MVALSIRFVFLRKEIAEEKSLAYNFHGSNSAFNPSGLTKVNPRKFKFGSAKFVKDVLNYHNYLKFQNPKWAGKGSRV